MNTTGRWRLLGTAPASRAMDVDLRVSGPPRIVVALPRWEWAFSASALLLVSGGGMPLVNQVLNLGGDIQRGNPGQQLVLSCVYTASLGLVIALLPHPFRNIRRTPLLWTLVGLAAVSVAWSAAPVVSARRVIALLGTSLLGLYLGTRYTWRGLFHLARVVGAICAVLSFAVALVLPDYYGPGSTGDGGWLGIFGSKNWLGRTMAFSAIIWLLRPSRTSLDWCGSLAVVLLSLSLVVLSKSVGSLMLLAGLLFFIAMLRAWRVHSALAVLFATLVSITTVIPVWFGTDAARLLGLVNRDASLTGRVPLWEAVWEMIEQRPLFGHGYGGFWIGWDGPSADVWAYTARTGGWLAPGSHNGFLDLALELGLLGTVLFLVGFALTAVRALILVRNEKTSEAFYPAVFLGLLILANITESDLVAHNSLYWTMYVALTIQLRHDEPVRRAIHVERQARMPYGHFDH